MKEANHRDLLDICTSIIRISSPIIEITFETTSSSDVYHQRYGSAVLSTKMKLTFAVAIALLQVWSIEASTREDDTPFVHIHPKEVVKRAGRDCGKFVMYCEKAAGACNNTCYHISCVDPGTARMVYCIPVGPFLSTCVANNARKLSYDAGNTNNKNRIHSGCQTSDGSVCNKMPFSQRFHDPLNKNPGDTTVNCDEWPMATVKQDDFKKGVDRNSLRCIRASENSTKLGCHFRLDNFQPNHAHRRRSSAHQLSPGDQYAGPEENLPG